MVTPCSARPERQGQKASGTAASQCPPVPPSLASDARDARADDRLFIILYGEHGAAKTNFLRRLRMLIDPHATATTALPLGARDLFIAARNTYMQAFQNVSKLSDAMSDNLCRLSDGGGLRTTVVPSIEPPLPPFGD